MSAFAVLEGFVSLKLGKFLAIVKVAYLEMGTECPSQAYASKWKAINLQTGKALLEDNFQSLHWDPTAMIESNAKSNNESNAQSHDHRTTNARN